MADELVAAASIMIFDLPSDQRARGLPRNATG